MVLSLRRSIGGVIAGLAITFVLIVAAEVFSMIYHPFPPGADTSDHAVIKAQVASYPTWVLAVGAAIWAAAWLATRLGPARHWSHGLTVGAILLALAGFDMAMLPYPIWFPVVILVGFPLGTILGTRVAQGPPIPKA